jgi:hypothetical protein
MVTWHHGFRFTVRQNIMVRREWWRHAFHNVAARKQREQEEKVRDKI